MLSKHIDFKGMNNLRDLGGMTNVSGKKIKSNLLFRSLSLSYQFCFVRTQRLAKVILQPQCNSS